MAGLDTTLRFEAVINQRNNASPIPAKIAATISAAIALLEGTGAAQADIIYQATPTIASGANLDLDLRGGVQDSFGQTIDMAKIAAIAIFNIPVTVGAAPNTTTITLGGGSNPVVGYMGGTNPTIPIPAGGFLVLAAPTVAGLCSVTAATADILRIANAAGAAANIQVLLIGKSA